MSARKGSVPTAARGIRAPVADWQSLEAYCGRLGVNPGHFLRTLIGMAAEVERLWQAAEQGRLTRTDVINQAQKAMQVYGEWLRVNGALVGALRGVLASYGLDLDRLRADVSGQGPLH